jgi:hypothetical protein
MKWFSYHCRSCGDFDLDGIAQDVVKCRCGRPANRKYQIGVIGSSLKPRDRWDPVVGAYVENDGQFRSLLHKSQEEQSEKLNMDCKLVEVDARDQEGLSELHGR